MPKILLVEDNELNRDMLGRRLKRRGYDVVIAVDGGEGVTKALTEQPDLILMDMSLPVMNGWEATKTLKAGEQTATIPIIALTAHAMVGDREEALSAGCDDYDTKPVDLKRLLQKIETLLQGTPEQAPRPVESVAQATPAAVVTPAAPPSEQLVTAAARTSPSEVHQEVREVASTPSPLPSSPASKPVSELTTHKLLVVDDVEANRDMLSRRLQRKGYEVALADSGEAALELIATTEITLVLLDIMMPGIGGIETLKRIRQTYSQEELPVIMATAKDASENVVEALELGANDYITKPIDLPIALARIQSHLKTRDASAVSRQQLLESTVAAAPQPSFWDEHFQLVEVLSKHAFGQTAIAKDLQELDTPLRIVHTFRLDTNNPEVLQAVQELFLAEMTTLKQLAPHLQCLPVLSFLQDSEVLHIVHEYVEGTILSKVLASHAPLNPRMTCKFADEVLTIIEILHQADLVHSHPHPDCFLQPNEKGKKLVLIDYGVVPRILSKLSVQFPQYQKLLQDQGDILAPEISYGTFKPETDQYVIGKTFLQALQPSASETDPEMVELHQATSQIFAQMCQFNIQSRYSTMYDANRAVRNHWHKLWKAELSKKQS
ncbi:response regulator [Acaryochloris marina NIES-2412]|uniref:response regulator n=1 Tax=Acaryochloris marina TaxID=155978 RepID=UPI004059ADB3